MLALPKDVTKLLDACKSKFCIKTNRWYITFIQNFGEIGSTKIVWVHNEVAKRNILLEKLSQQSSFLELFKRNIAPYKCKWGVSGKCCLYLQKPLSNPSKKSPVPSAHWQKCPGSQTNAASSPGSRQPPVSLDRAVGHSPQWWAAKQAPKRQWNLLWLICSPKHTWTGGACWGWRSWRLFDFLAWGLSLKIRSLSLFTS